MKKFAAICLVAIAAFAFTSCKKCVTCTYTDDVGDEQVATSCGNSANEDLENDLNEQWGSYGSVTCLQD